MTWEQTGYGCERLVDENGRILADVERSFVKSETSAVLRFKGSIGSFNTLENAKKAVEAALQEPPK